MKRFLIAIILVSLLVTLCSCNENSSTKNFPDIKGPISLVIIVGRHANAGKPTTGMLEKANDLINKAFTPPQKTNSEWNSTANISIIVSQKFPEVIELPKELRNISAPYERNVRNKISTYADAIRGLLISDDLKAKSDEVDLLASLELARVYLSNSADNLEKYILILDTGITTAGHFDMRKTNILYGQPSEVVNRLPQGQLPDLSGITVIFDGIGNVPNDQTNGQTIALTSNQNAKKALKGVWIELLTNKCNATLYNGDIGEATLGENQPYLEGGGGYPYVSTVAFLPPVSLKEIIEEIIKEEEIIKKDEVQIEIPPPIDSVFNASTFFGGDDYTLNEEAVANLQTIALEIYKFLKDDRIANENVYVIGSIANTQNNLQVSSNRISAGRANAVADNLKNQLKDFGVDVNRIIPIDAGTTVLTGWRDTNEFVNGEWKDELAQKNRVVAIISSNSQKAQVEGLKPYIQR